MQKIINDAVNNKVVKNTKFNTPKTKVNTLDKQFPDATILIHINQYNTDKQNLEKNIRDADKKMSGTRYKWLSDYNCFKYNTY